MARNTVPWFSASKNVWINKELFTEHADGFVSFIQAQKLDDGRPHLILLDQHYSYLYNLEFLQVMKANKIHIWLYQATPATGCNHWIAGCSRVSRPRGVTKCAYSQETAGRKLEKKDFFLVFNKAWGRSMTVDNSQGGIKGPGSYHTTRWSSHAQNSHQAVPVIEPLSHLRPAPPRPTQQLPWVSSTFWRV